MYSDAGDTTSLVPGFPIRTSSDPRSVDSSPRHNAASHVLHRLPMPRHPPCALKHLQHKTKKMNHPRHESKNCTYTTTHTTTPPPQKGRAPLCMLDARNHYPRIKHHTPPPKMGQQQDPTPPNLGHHSGIPHRRRDRGPVVSKPNSVSGDPAPAFDHSKPPGKVC